MSVSLPTSSLRIGPYDIAVLSWEPRSAQANNSSGEFSSTEMCIRINCRTDRLFAVDTVLHEILHAIYWAYQIKPEDGEERTVTVLATAWLQVYRDNPGLLLWLYDTIHQGDDPSIPEAL